MNDANTDRGARSSAGMIRRYAPLVLLVAAIVIVFANGWHRYLSLEQIAEHREALRGFVDEHLFLALLAYLGVYVVVVALSVPGGALLTITGGFLFGWLVGGVATVVGATVGATFIFLIARTSLGATLSAKAGPWLQKLSAKGGPWLQKLSQGFQEDAMSYLLFLRLVPAFPFWLVNLAPALLGVGLSTFVIGTFIGIIPGTFALSFVGAGLDRIINDQQEIYDACVASGAEQCEFSLDPSSLLNSTVLMAFAALGVVAVIPVILKKLRARRSAEAK